MFLLLHLDISELPQVKSDLWWWSHCCPESQSESVTSLTCDTFTLTLTITDHVVSGIKWERQNVPVLDSYHLLTLPRDIHRLISGSVKQSIDSQLNFKTLTNCTSKNKCYWLTTVLRWLMVIGCQPLTHAPLLHVSVIWAQIWRTRNYRKRVKHAYDSFIQIVISLAKHNNSN